jgi:NAD+ kinase
MKRILLSPNISRDKELALTRKVIGLLKGWVAEIVVCPLFDEDCTYPEVEGIEVSDLEAALNGADMVIAFGGDGTILRVARMAAEEKVPVLGINMGSKGFMAELEQEDIGLILNVVRGEYALERRMMLDVALSRDGSVIHRDFALNDVVVAGITKVIDLTLYGDGKKITHFSGDGTIVSTPTGSTAYSMAAGGPIVEPEADNIIVTPICAHVLAAKAFVLASDRVVSVELGAVKTNPAYLTVDGGAYLELVSGDVITVRKSAKETLLIHLSNRSFYKKVNEKLGEKF